MNTTTHFAKASMTNAGDMISALENGMEKSYNAPFGIETSEGRGFPRKWSSGLTNTARTKTWMSRGIPELDSLLADY